MSHREKQLRWVVFALLLMALAVAAWSWWSEGLAFALLNPATSATEKMQGLRASFQQWGAGAPLMYLTFVLIEVVVAPIPGTMLYAPGGAVFGGLLGGSLTLLGNTLGAGLACLIARGVGSAWLAGWYDEGKLGHIGALIERRGLWIVLLLRINPLTSSDLVSYAAGLTTIPVWKVMAGTMIGMSPLCFAQAWFAERLLSEFPWLLYPGLVLCGVYAVAVVCVLLRLQQRGRSDTPRFS